MTDTVVQQWVKLEEKALVGGGNARIERQHQLGKKTARERLALLLDPSSFFEIDRLAVSPFLDAPELTDGVIAGFGSIQGRKVAVYAQDFTIKGGSLGKRHAEKIAKVMDMAAKIGCPIIGIIDSGGARIDEGIHALAGYGSIFRRNCQYSGVVPQFSIIVGPCAGGAVYSPAITDVVFMTKDISQMFITGPQVIEEVLHQSITKEALGGIDAHGRQSGVAHVICETENDCFASLQDLLSYFPDSYLDQPPAGSPVLPTTMYNTPHIPENPQQSYNIKDIISTIIDDTYFELHTDFAANIVTCFARLNGQVVGIVANQPLVKAGCIDIDASCKAARFIRLCDSFGIPIVTLVDTPGYLPGVEQEHNGIIRHGAKLLYAYATATVPKITLILRKAIGGAYIVMGSKELAADFNFAWPSAQIAVLGAKAAITIMRGKELAALNPAERALAQASFESAYTEEFLHPFTAAAHGYIDAIVQPQQTREQLIQALQLTRDKVEIRPTRKHGNIPL
ncbi:acyl-CoA carboxylase subunit beta [Candidatus Dependentiae bacterium]|nr:acyl-CoA carboxylase subunit beta [Candidatus Dependentiae bacterium]